MNNNDLSTELLGLLLSATKDELGITWEDSDSRLTRYIKQSYNWLLKFNDGDPVAFDEFSTEFMLIVNRSRYLYHNSVDEFEKNYALEIGYITFEYAIKKEEAKNATGN